MRTERGGFAGFVYAQRSKPWIAAVEGKALAGGFELVLACDLVVASEAAEFGLPEVKRGLIAGAGGIHRLCRKLPYAKALEVILTGVPMNARTAQEAGLLNAVVPPGKTLEAARKLADLVAENAPLCVRDSLRIAKASYDRSEYELRTLAAECLSQIALSNDYQEGPRAFIEKRAPQWTGT